MLLGKAVLLGKPAVNSSIHRPPAAMRRGLGESAARPLAVPIAPGGTPPAATAAARTAILGRFGSSFHVRIDNKSDRVVPRRDSAMAVMIHPALVVAFVEFTHFSEPVAFQRLLIRPARQPAIRHPPAPSRAIPASARGRVHRADVDAGAAHAFHDRPLRLRRRPARHGVRRLRLHFRRRHPTDRCRRPPCPRRRSLRSRPHQEGFATGFRSRPMNHLHPVPRHRCRTARRKPSARHCRQLRRGRAFRPLHPIGPSRARGAGRHDRAGRVGRATNRLDLPRHHRGLPRDYGLQWNRYDLPRDRGLPKNRDLQRNRRGLLRDLRGLPRAAGRPDPTGRVGRVDGGGGDDRRDRCVLHPTRCPLPLDHRPIRPPSHDPNRSLRPRRSLRRLPRLRRSLPPKPIRRAGCGGFGGGGGATNAGEEKLDRRRRWSGRGREKWGRRGRLFGRPLQPQRVGQLRPIGRLRGRRGRFRLLRFGRRRCRTRRGAGLGLVRVKFRLLAARPDHSNDFRFPWVWANPRSMFRCAADAMCIDRAGVPIVRRGTWWF